MWPSNFSLEQPSIETWWQQSKWFRLKNIYFEGRPNKTTHIFFSWYFNILLYACSVFWKILWEYNGHCYSFMINYYILYVSNYNILYVYLIIIYCVYFCTFKKSNTSNASFGENVYERDGGPVCEMLNALIYFGHKCPLILKVCKVYP